MLRKTRLMCVLGAVLAAALALVVWQAPQVASAENGSGGGSPQDVTWSFDPTQSKDLPTLEGNSDTWSRITIDATSGKFYPRTTDTQINAGTKLALDVPESVAGATLTITPSGNTALFEVSIDGSPAVPYTATTSNPAEVAIGADGGKVGITFTDQSYLQTMTLTYGEAPEEFPGTPESVEAKDTTWDLAQTGETIQNTRGEFQGIKVDAENGKFDPLGTYTQVNGGTVLYIPVAPGEATLMVSGNDNSGAVTLRVDDATPAKLNEQIDINSDSARYLKVEFISAESDKSSNVTSISIDYAADTSTYPGTPESVEAKDTTWDLTQGGDAIEKTKGEFQGIKVDATAGKFAPGSDSTQVNDGTVLYVPVAADTKGAVLRIEANNYNNLDLTVDGEPAQIGTDIALTATEARYVPIEFSGDGSCYLTSISVDYASDATESTHVVTVGPGGDYATINEALADNDSSLKDRLVISIAPGSYHERVVIDKPGVTLQNADETGENPVVIHESYFSGNVWVGDDYAPQDPVYDLGTDQCATVLVEATATGFSARGITFQNDYNVVDNLGEDEQTPAVAFNSKADKVELVDCSFIGRQDTLYVQGAGNRVFVSGCYVEGTVDFVFGDADAYFHRCTLHMAAFPGRTSGYYTAANTKVGYTGLVFANCTLTADASLDDVSLGRPWQNLCYYSETTHDSEGHTIYRNIDTSRPNDLYANVSSAVTFVGCTMPENLNATRWDRWTGRNEDGETVSVTYDKTVRFAEYGSRNADGTLASPSTDESMTFLTFMPEADLKAKAAELRAQMKIGGSYWVPSHLGFVEDDDFWSEGEPAAPIEPADPVDPVDPVNPVNPVDPVNPTDPTDPADPVNPAEPTDPAEPVDPSDPADPTQPATDAAPADEAEGLAATGDATSVIPIAACAAGAAVLLAGSYVARRRLG